MSYRVEVTATAKAEIEAAYLWLQQRWPRTAVVWFNGLSDAIDDLAELPERCALAREARHFDEEIRQLLYGKRPHVYRVLFVVRGDVVHVLHVRHSARKELGPADMVFPPDDPTP